MLITLYASGALYPRKNNNGPASADHNDAEPFAALAIRANQKAPRCVIPSNTICTSSNRHDPSRNPLPGYTSYITIPVGRPSPLPILLRRESIRFASARIADRLSITRILLIITFETYRSKSIDAHGSAAYHDCSRLEGRGVFNPPMGWRFEFHRGIQGASVYPGL